MNPYIALGLLVLSVLPGLVGLALNRRLDPQADDETLLARSLAMQPWRLFALWLAIFGIVVAGVLVRPTALLFLLPLIVGALFAAWDNRRRLLGERWGFASYAGFRVRFLAAFAGPIVLLILAPWLITLTPRPIVAGLAAAVVLLVVFHAHHRTLPWLLGARPWRPDPALAARLDDIDARAALAPVPDRQLIPVGPGKFFNAFAVPHTKRASVLYTSALADGFDDDRLVGIYAHEVAHLEQFRRPRVRWGLEAISLLLIGAGAFVVPRLWGSETWGELVPLLWWLVVLSLLLARGRWTQGLESAADARAVELLEGDSEALATALEDLHRLQRMPRRLAPEVEGRMTHPSLARRLQAIRRLSGHAATRPAEDGVFFAPDGASALVFTPERLHRLSGLPVEGETGTASVSDLAALARSSRSDAYETFTDLRLSRDREGRPRVSGAEAGGDAWAVPVREEDVSRLAEWLDAVDGELAEAPRRRLLGPVARRLLGLVGIWFALFVPGALPAVALTGLLLLVTGKRAATASFAVALLGAAFLAAQGWASSVPGTTSGLAAFLAGLALLLGFGVWRAAPEGRVWATALTCLGVALGGLAVVVHGAGVLHRGVTSEDRFFALSDALAAWPWTWILLLAGAAALALHARRLVRVVGVGVAVLSLAAATLSLAPVRRAVVPDPLDGAAPSEVPVLQLREVDRWRVTGPEGFGPELRVAPGGARAAVRNWDVAESEVVWRVYARDDSAAVLSFPGGSFEFLGPDTGLHHRREPEPRLVHVDLVSGERREIEVKETFVDLRVDPDGSWTLAGTRYLESGTRALGLRGSSASFEGGPVEPLDRVIGVPDRERSRLVRIPLDGAAAPRVLADTADLYWNRRVSVAAGRLLLTTGLEHWLWDGHAETLHRLPNEPESSEPWDLTRSAAGRPVLARLGEDGVLMFYEPVGP